MDGREVAESGWCRNEGLGGLLIGRIRIQVRLCKEEGGDLWEFR
jgi:hypothetical protein